MNRSPLLRIERFCGHQIHHIESVSTYISRDAASGSTLLNLEFGCGAATEEVAPEGEQTGWAKPSIEVWIPVPSLDPSALDEHRVHIAESYRADHDALNRLYVFEHAGWHAIDVYLQVIGGRLWVECDGRTQDLNWYDGSKPEAKVSLRAWVDLSDL